MCACVCMCACVRVCVYVRLCVCVCVWMDGCVGVLYACVLMCAETHDWSTHWHSVLHARTHARAYTHTHTHINIRDSSRFKRDTLHSFELMNVPPDGVSM